MTTRLTEDGRWYDIEDVGAIASPALVFYPDRIEENVRRMIRMAGGAGRLRPHVKTHKCADVVRLQLRQGIRKFKCSTIAEAEMAASAGAPDVLLAMQPVGPAVGRFFALQQTYPGTAFAAIVDAEAAAGEIARAAVAAGTDACLWLDVNSGMNRTGIAPGADAARLYRRIHESPGLRAGGLHVYDGHIHESGVAERTRVCDAQFAPVAAMIEALRASGLPVPAVVAGGSPTFPIHAKRTGVELSPGTPLLWDAGYGAAYPDLEFLVAAVVVSRVVSKPGDTLVCLDLGTKAVASEMPQPRASLLGVREHRVAAHNEEHLVIDVPDPGRFGIGDVVYAVPIHICPTVARYEAAHVVRDGRRAGEWPIAARNRRITV